MADLHQFNHYRFRAVQPEAVDVEISLHGQFDTDWWLAHLRSMSHLGSPAEKWHTEHWPIVSHDEHLTVYDIDPRPEQRCVRVTNQFTNMEPQEWQIGDAELLLVPASKRHGSDDGELPAPDKGEHYACYRVLGRKPVNRLVDIKDQFDTVPQKVIVRRPLYLAVPVVKTHGQKAPTSFVHEEIHLVLYEIRPEGKDLPVATTSDQFGTRSIRMGDDMLGVPSFKEVIAQTRR